MRVTETRYLTAEPTKCISQEKCRRFLENAKLSPIIAALLLKRNKFQSALQKEECRSKYTRQDNTPFCPANNDT